MALPPSLQIKSTKDLITPDMKLCLCIHGLPKTGKTTMAGTLNDLTLQQDGRKSLFIACETAEGGGTMVLNNKDIDYVQPQTYPDFLAALQWLQTDTTYGGVILDNGSDYAKKFLLPYALSVPNNKEAHSQMLRLAGVPGRSDYQTMGNKGIADLNPFVALSAHPNPKVRKHIVFVTHSKERTDDNGIITSILPDLPGALALGVSGLFQTVGHLKKIRLPATKDSQTGRPVPGGVRVVFDTKGSDVVLAGDRTKLFPPAEECPLSLLDIWDEYFLPQMQPNLGV